MVITGSAIFIEPGTDREVVEGLKSFPGVTFQGKSDSGTELVVNFEAEDLQALEELTFRVRDDIKSIVDIAHVYVDFEEEIEKIALNTTVEKA